MRRKYVLRSRSLDIGLLGWRRSRRGAGEANTSVYLVGIPPGKREERPKEIDDVSVRDGEAEAAAVEEIDGGDDDDCCCCCCCCC